MSNGQPNKKQKKSKFQYLNGFGNLFESEALPNSLPQG